MAVEVASEPWTFRQMVSEILLKRLSAAQDNHSKLRSNVNRSRTREYTITIVAQFK